MTEPMCEKCFLSGICFIRREFNKLLLELRPSYTDLDPLPIEREFHKLLARHCRHYKGLDDENVP